MDHAIVVVHNITYLGACNDDTGVTVGLIEVQKVCCDLSTADPLQNLLGGLNQVWRQGSRTTVSTLPSADEPGAYLTGIMSASGA